MLDDFFSQLLYKAPDGRVYLHDKDTKETLNFTDMQRQYRSGEIHFGYGLDQQAFFQVVELHLPRGGCHIFFNLGDLYTSLALDSFKGVASKWAYSVKSRTSTRIEADLGFFDTFLSSPQGEAVEDAMVSMTHFLPWPCASTLGLLTLLSRFGTSSSQMGGLQEIAQQRRARDLLHGFVKGIGHVVAVTPGFNLSEG